MLNSRFTIQIHILCLLAISDQPTSSELIASSINCNSVLVRKELSKLKSSGFIQTTEGKKGGASLLKNPKDIYLDEVFACSFSQKELFGKNKNDPNPKCTVGRNINDIMTKINQEAALALMGHLHTMRLKDLIKDL